MAYDTTLPKAEAPGTSVRQATINPPVATRRSRWSSPGLPGPKMSCSTVSIGPEHRAEPVPPRLRSGRSTHRPPLPSAFAVSRTLISPDDARRPSWGWTALRRGRPAARPPSTPTARSSQAAALEDAAGAGAQSRAGITCPDSISFISTGTPGRARLALRHVQTRRGSLGIGDEHRPFGCSACL